MIYIISWDKYEVIQVEKVANKYISIINKDNFLRAVSIGMPAFILSSIKIVYYEVPKLILNRIPAYKELNERDIISYINNTECKYNTDKFSVRIIE